MSTPGFDPNKHARDRGGRFTEMGSPAGGGESDVALPHPTGGYVRVNNNPLSGNTYLDADGQPHREDGPAIVAANGDGMWLRHGQLHRDGGPATMLRDSDGQVREGWFHDGIEDTPRPVFDGRTAHIPHDADGYTRIGFSGGQDWSPAFYDRASDRLFLGVDNPNHAGGTYRGPLRYIDSENGQYAELGPDGYPLIEG